MNVNMIHCVIRRKTTDAEFFFHSSFSRFFIQREPDELKTSYCCDD